MRSTWLMGCAVLLGSLIGCSTGGGGSEKASREATASPPGAPPPSDPHGAKPTGGSAGARSAVPTVDEWSRVGEVTVKGSSALGCETKMVREWLRVSCHGKNNTGGTPTNVVVNRGGSAEHFTFAQSDVTSLVMPFLDGTNIDATFSWTDASHKLTVQWPHGSPKPEVVGVFAGAASPLDSLGCMECADEGDQVKARAAGKKCCPNPPCTSQAQCSGRKCCAGATGAFCAGACDMGNSTPVCSSDAECPSFAGQKLKCKPHSSGSFKNCQGS